MKIKLIILIFSIVLIENIYSQTYLNEDEFKGYLKDNISNLDPLEGIWSASATTDVKDDYKRILKSDYKPQFTKYAIIKKGEIFEVYIVEENFKKSTSVFAKTASEGVYLFSKSDPAWYKDAKANAFIKSDGVMEYAYESHYKEAKIEVGGVKTPVQIINSITLVKLYPTKNEIQVSKKSSGTGFAISNNGLIATNYHVVENAKQLKVKGINGDFSKFYNAKIITFDKNNDLAIIKIEDNSFTTLGAIPYSLKSTTSEVGENINVLGYPLTATMGEEIKYTNGIISSKSGFQGDITSYQCSAPVQPGNSGGPVFNKQGNIIAIINAKHYGAENVSYAIKTNYLINLIQSLPFQIKINNNLLATKPLTEQIKSISKFVYIIEN